MVKDLPFSLDNGGTLEMAVQFISSADLFGLDLVTVTAREGRKVPQIVETIVKAIEKQGVEMEGLYRKPGNARKVNEYKANFIADANYQFPHQYNIHHLASLLKQYFRELPEPLFTTKLYVAPRSHGSVDVARNNRVRCLQVCV